MILEDEIRILILLPHHGHSAAPIKCHLQVSSLEESPGYEALSYVWGDQNSLVDIEVESQKVGITKNLHAALFRLRVEGKKRRLWIDQLCINQWDTREKEQQVRLMRRIYSQCQRCVFWMGEIPKEVAEAGAIEALGLLKYMAEVYQAGSDEGVSVPHCLDSDLSFGGTIKALRALSMEQNPWWERVWTVQEAVLPPEKMMLWSSLVLPWKTLRQATLTWTQMTPDCLDIRLKEPWKMKVMAEIMAMVVWLDTAKLQHDRPVFLVNQWRFREATDPRDKIYALMGLCSSGSMPSMEKCNYDMSAVDVFCDLTFDLMRSENDLFPLIMDPRLEIEKATPGIPRWALDASHISEWNTDWFHLFAWPSYNAHGGKRLDLSRMLIRREEARHILEVEGVLVDTIAVVGEPSISARDEDVDPQLRREQIRTWETLAREHVKRGVPESSELYPGGYTLRQAFGRLILGDLLRNNEQRVEAPADEEDVESVYNFMESGKLYWTHRTIKGSMDNQRFFVIQTGLMGIGHMETQPGEEVWVFHGGNFPFTIIPREGKAEDDYDFGGRCYVQGIMNGEAFQPGTVARTLMLH